MFHAETKVRKSELFSTLPPQWEEDLFSQIQERVRSSGRKVVVLDDDPTGTQTVHSVPVLTQWSKAELRSALASQEVLFYILTNSRSYPSQVAVPMNQKMGQLISSALVEVVSRLKIKPRFVVAKGGITSSDIGTQALGVRQATVAGQILPGVPVWILGGESRFPGIPYVIFPGNVGDRQSLARVIEILRGEETSG